MKPPKFSILIPTFNRAHFLGETIESALAQDYSDFEVIVSDNASSDATGVVVAKYAGDSRFKYFKNPTNIGLFPNWTRLLYEYASGDYALFLPDDDYILNARHLSDAARLLEHRRVNFIFTDAIFENQVSGITKKINFDVPEYLSVDWAVDNVGCRFRDNIAFSPGLASVFNVRRARELQVLFPHVCGSDGELGLRFMFDGPSAYLKDPQRVARGHAQSAGNTDQLENTLNSLLIHGRMVEFGQSRGIERARLIRYQRRNILLWLGEIVLPMWFALHGPKYSRLMLFLWKNRAKYGIDLVGFLQIVVSPQIIGKFVRRRNPRIFGLLRHGYWLLKYKKTYPKEFYQVVSQ